MDDRQPVTLKQAISAFVEDRRSLRRRPRTIHFYEGNLGRFASFLVEQYADELVDRGLIERDQVDELPVDVALSRGCLRHFFARLAERDVSEATHATYDRCLRTFNKFCLAEGWVEKDAMATRPRIRPAQQLPDTLTRSEIGRLLATCDGGTPADVRDRAIMLVMLDTGMRAGEVCEMDRLWLLIIGDNGTITIPGKFAKSRRPRTVFITSSTIEACRAWWAIHPGCDREFVALTGRGTFTDRPLTPNGLNQMMHRRAARAGIKGKRKWCHIWRHTFARSYVVGGGDLESLRLLMGHSSLEVLRVYLNFKTEDLNDKHAQFSPVKRLFRQPADKSPDEPSDEPPRTLPGGFDELY